MHGLIGFRNTSRGEDGAWNSLGRLSSGLVEALGMSASLLFVCLQFYPLKLWVSGGMSKDLVLIEPDPDGNPRFSCPLIGVSVMRGQ